MNTATTYPPVTKLRSYLSSEKLPVSLVPVDQEQEQPRQSTNVLAHEIRNPLSTINLATQMLKTLVVDDSQKVYLDIIIRGAERINDIVTDLLTPSKPAQLQQEKHSVHQLLDEVLAMAEDKFLLKNITVRKDYAVQDCKIVLNKSKMKIALTNIIINAIDAMPVKHGQLKVVTKSVNGKCVIEIADNGAGISKENLKNIFKPYFTSKPGGMGVGLSATRDILFSNHAVVKVQSEEGSGTKFILVFPKKSRSLFPVRNRPDLSEKIALVPMG